MRTLKMVVFGLGLGALAMPVSAETLRVVGVYPAHNGDAAEVQSIGIEQFGGIDGPTLSIKAADALRSASIDGEPYFRVAPASVMRDGDAVLSGSVATDVNVYRASPKEVETCVNRDDKNKCLEKRKEKVPCEQLTLSVRPTIRLYSYDGALIHDDDAESQRQVRYCADESEPAIDPMVDEGLDEIAARLRYALAPQQRAEDIRVLETRKGMEKEPGRAFRDAIAMTKRDEEMACDAFAALEPTIGEHVSLLFNIGLCAEAGGDLDRAQEYYRRAIKADPSKSNAGEGLDRIRARQEAERQLAIHYGD